MVIATKSFFQNEKTVTWQKFCNKSVFKINELGISTFDCYWERCVIRGVNILVNTQVTAVYGLVTFLCYVEFADCAFCLTL